MRLTERTDYALRVLMVLAADRGRISVPAMAATLCVSANHLTKVVQTLQGEGWVTTSPGRGGGVELHADTQRLTVGEVVRTIETGFDLVECQRAGGRCPLDGPCRLTRVLEDARAAFLGELDSVTISDLIRGRRAALTRLVVIRGGD